MAFQNNNVSENIAANANVQVGRSDFDNGQDLERNIGLPWAADPAGSYVYYDCAIGVMLDSGIVVHNRLPQINKVPDSLAATFLDAPDMDKVVDRGVNLRCNDQYQDIMQRMAHSRYWFRIWGQALRIGYKVPIPGIKTIAGVPAIPYDKNPQWAYNSITPGGNFGGLILWRAQWSLWYTTLIPPKSQIIPAADPSAHIADGNRLPKAVQSSYSKPDSNATTKKV